MEACLKITYTFVFQNGATKTFDLVLDRKTLSNAARYPANQPAWTLLSRNQCANCSLDLNRHPFCPVALNFAEIAEHFIQAVSHEPVRVVVTTEERTYSKDTSLQQGLASLLGIVMTTSGCPVLEPLKPMVRFHLPFATIEETTYRAVSMYLVAQYCIKQHGGQPDWELYKLADAYENICTVNENFCKRLRTLKSKDANINALVVLDIFANSVNLSIDRRMVDDLDYLFKGYFK